MSYAPAARQADRDWLVEHLDAHPNSSGYPADLDPAEIGIVGNAAHTFGYHLGKDRLPTNDYSRITKRDKAGLTDAASALDVGQFAIKDADGMTHTQRDLAVWIVAECRAGAPGTKDIREVIYTPDGKVVLRWDRERGQNSLPKAGEADDSHLTHDHLSLYRDAEDRPLVPLFRRWHEEIMMPTPEEYAKAVVAVDAVPAPRPPVNDPDYGDPNQPTDGNKTWRLGNYLRTILEDLRELAARPPAQLVLSDADRDAIVAELTAALVPEIEAAAERAVRNVAADAATP